MSVTGAMARAVPRVTHFNCCLNIAQWPVGTYTRALQLPQ